MDNPWKTMLLAIGLALASMPPGIAQVSDSSDGLYAPPDAKQAQEAQSDSTTARAADSFIKSLDPELEALDKRVDSAIAAKKAAAMNRDGASLGGDQRWIPWSLGLSESAVVALLAAMGLGVSIFAVGYVWRTRTAAGPAVPVLLNVARQAPSDASLQGSEDQRPAPRRRAA